MKERDMSLTFDRPADLTTGRLSEAAMERTALRDFGPDHYVDALDILTRSMREEADLSAFGVAAQAERLVNALANRLRKQRLLSLHPEIAEQRVDMAALIVGLPRTGSTMLHRLLAESPKLTAVRWWES